MNNNIEEIKILRSAIAALNNIKKSGLFSEGFELMVYENMTYDLEQKVKELETSGDEDMANLSESEYQSNILNSQGSVRRIR